MFDTVAKNLSKLGYTVSTFETAADATTAKVPSGSAAVCRCCGQSPHPANLK